MLKTQKHYSSESDFILYSFFFFSLCRPMSTTISPSSWVEWIGWGEHVHGWWGQTVSTAVGRKGSLHGIAAWLCWRSNHWGSVASSRLLAQHFRSLKTPFSFIRTVGHEAVSSQTPYNFFKWNHEKWANTLKVSKLYCWCKLSELELLLELDVWE